MNWTDGIAVFGICFAAVVNFYIASIMYRRYKYEWQWRFNFAVGIFLIIVAAMRSNIW